MKITREIVNDLWPVYSAGEASADTCALVEEFLRQDPEYAGLVKGQANLFSSLEAPSLPANLEIAALNQTKRQLSGPRWLFLFAVLFSCFAFGRIIADTSWDKSPKPFIVTAAIAAVFWIVFFVRRSAFRRKVLSFPRTR